MFWLILVWIGLYIIYAQWFWALLAYTIFINIMLWVISINTKVLLSFIQYHCYHCSLSVFVIICTLLLTFSVYTLSIRVQWCSCVDNKLSIHQLPMQSSVCLSVCLFVGLFVCLSICLSVYLSVCLAVWLSGCLFVCLSVWTDVIAIQIYFVSEWVRDSEGGVSLCERWEMGDGG